MINKYIVGLMVLCISLPAFAFEDYILTTNGKLTDIKIQHNDIIDVCPLVTIDNNKNTLIIHPLREGETKFTVLKNKKDKYLFNVKVEKDKTFVEAIEGFGLLTIDNPPQKIDESFVLDEPPKINNTNDTWLMQEEAKKYQDYIDNLDTPPELRGMD